MAVFRKILGKGKKGPAVKIKSDIDNTGAAAELARDEEVEKKKQEWQSELGHMSEFLYLKSTSEQQEEGITRPTDTAWIEDKDGMPVLKASFDVGIFKEDDIALKLEGNQLLLTAKTVETHDEREYTRTIVRKLDLPEHVDARMMDTKIQDGQLHIEMPFHMPPQKRPKGPNVFPIVTDPVTGRRKLRILIYIGSDFTSDDVSVETTDNTLHIRATYDEEIGKYGTQVTKREFMRDYQLPEHLNAESCQSKLAPDGRLYIEILLHDEPGFKRQLPQEVETIVAQELTIPPEDYSLFTQDESLVVQDESLVTHDSPLGESVEAYVVQEGKQLVITETSINQDESLVNKGESEVCLNDDEATMETKEINDDDTPSISTNGDNSDLANLSVNDATADEVPGDIAPVASTSAIPPVTPTVVVSLENTNDMTIPSTLPNGTSSQPETDSLNTTV